MSQDLTIKLGVVQDFVVAKASFDKDQSVTISFAAQAPNSTAMSTGSFNPGVPWHQDLREAVRKLDIHCARISGQLGMHYLEHEDDFTVEMLNWWEEYHIGMRIISITWAGANHSKIKVMGEARLPDGYTLLNCPLIDLDRSSYEFLGEFETLMANVRDEIVAYIGGKTAIGRQTTIFDEMEANAVKAETVEDEPVVDRLPLPEAKNLVTPDSFRKAIEDALKGQGADAPKLKKGVLSNISEHMRLFCIANGAFIPNSTFVLSAFANSVARAIIDALKEVKVDDKALPFLVELRATTEPGTVLKWRELYNVMQPELAGQIDNTQLALACVAFARLMIKEGIAPLQQWHSPILFGEHLVATIESNNVDDFAQIIDITCNVYSHFIQNNK